MAKRLVVSTIGCPMLTGGTGVDPQSLVTRAKAHWQEQLAAVLPDRPDLIVLPENCDMYRDLTPEESAAYLDARCDELRDFFAAVAQRESTHIAYSSRRLLADGTRRNSTQLIGPQGTMGVYDKNYVIDAETHSHNILCGNALSIADTPIGRIGFIICFDLNFDELRLRMKAAKPDIVVFSSAYHGGMMQPYWAYSCRAHFVSAIFDTHPSVILSPVGEELARTTNYQPHVTTEINVDCALVHLDYHAEKLAALKAAYGRDVTIFDPGYLGSVLVTSNRTDRTAADLLAEFDLMPLDDYLAHATAHRQANLAPGDQDSGCLG